MERGPSNRIWRHLNVCVSVKINKRHATAILECHGKPRLLFTGVLTWTDDLPVNIPAAIQL